VGFADFEFQHKDYWANDKYDIDAFTHAGDGVLEIDSARAIG
jgi:hypothetical protein